MDVFKFPLGTQSMQNPGQMLRNCNSACILFTPFQGKGGAGRDLKEDSVNEQRPAGKAGRELP